MRRHKGLLKAGNQNNVKERKTEVKTALMKKAAVKRLSFCVLVLLLIGTDGIFVSVRFKTHKATNVGVSGLRWQ